MAGITKSEIAKALGVSATELDQVVAQVKQQPAAEVKAAPVETKPQSVKDKADAVLADNGLRYHSGRVYFFKALIEAQARALNSKKPSLEVVQSPKDGALTVAVLVIRDENGVTYSQNLKKA